MANSLPSVSVLLVRPLAAALAGSPAALARFYAATDLTPELVADAECRVSPAQFCIAWAEALRLSGDPELAVHLAAGTPPGAFGLVEYVCRSAPTLGDALAQWCRYLGILDDAVTVRIVDVDAGGPRTERRSIRVVRESEAPAAGAHELCFALLVKSGRTLVADFEATEVCFTHRGTDAHAAALRAFFAAPVRLGAAHTELVLPARVLAMPLASADPNLLAVLLPAADERRDRKSEAPAMTDRVRRALRAALSVDDAQLEPVARRLGLTGRSLQRALKDEGRSFQELRDEVRRELADRYLGQGLSLAEISFLLGFSEPSAFFRAFKRWTGLTPLERRAALAPA